MLYYDEYGSRENPTILLLHGAGAADTFCRQYCFSENYHLIVPHLPGAGRAAGEIYEPEKIAEELSVLINKLGKKRIGIIGHSLGAQIAVKLVSRNPERFSFAVFLSAWVNPNPKTVRMYSSLAGLSVKLLHWSLLMRLQGRYWNYTKKQADAMAEYSKQITPAVYRSFFTHTLDLSELPEYDSVSIPMLAVCGSREIRSMKTSLALLAQNPNCQSVILQGANHDYPMRGARELNPVLEKFLSAHHI